MSGTPMTSEPQGIVSRATPMRSRFRGDNSKLKVQLAMTSPHYRASAIALLALTLLGACAQSPGPSQIVAANNRLSAASLAPRGAASAPTSADAESRRASSTATNTDVPPKPASGLGVFQQLGQEPLVRLPRPIVSSAADEKGGTPITLNIENGDIREIVKNILGDSLNENFMIDPRVTGTVTIRTPKGVSRGDLVATLEILLRTVGASLVRDGQLWRVLPATEAVVGITTPRLGLGSGQGASVTVRPVRFVGAKEMQRLISPFARGGEAAVRVDELRNLLFLTGSETEVRHLLEIADMFDVDVLAGMSILLYPLQSAEAKTVLAEWERVFPANLNPFTGLLRITAIDRMNSLLLISPRPEIIVQARQMLERLDAGQDAGGGTRLFVHVLRYTQAEKLQPLLQQVMSGTRGTGVASAATVAPGQRPNTIVTPVPGQSLSLPGNVAGAPVVAAPVNNAVGATGIGAGIGAAAQGSGLARTAVIVADKDRNALLIVATPAEYATIEAALRKLDTPPKQVAIEVQIAEVSLSGALQFGLQSYFQGKVEGSQNRLTSADGLGQIVGGAFTYTWKRSDALKAILNLADSRDKIRTLAQPTLITIENQKATFNAGKQISVRTQSSSNLGTGTTTSTDSFQYITTGISINVTPRVSGDNVFLEISQENSDAGVAAEGNPNPPITRRAATTNVMVVSGDTMLMGGLFQDNSRNSTSGLPVLSAIPGVGGLFGSQTWQSDRTELVLLITPRIMGSVEETRDVVDELRRKMQNIETLIPAAATTALPASSEVKARQRLNADALRDVSTSLRIGRDPSKPTEEAVR
jgi:general secretion pathway protein D